MAKRGRPAAYDRESAEALAGELGVSTTCVRKWLRRDDWPFGQAGPWDSVAVADWRATNLDPARGGRAGQVGDIDDGEGEGEDGPARQYPLIVPTGDPAVDAILRTMTPGRQAKLRGEIERGKKTSLENMVTQRGLVPRAEVEKGWVARVIAVRSRLLALPRQLAADLAMRTEVEVEQALDREVRALCESFAAE